MSSEMLRRQEIARKDGDTEAVAGVCWGEDIQWLNPTMPILSALGIGAWQILIFGLPAYNFYFIGGCYGKQS